MSILAKAEEWLFYKETSGLRGFIKMCIFCTIFFILMFALIALFSIFAMVCKMLLGI